MPSSSHVKVAVFEPVTNASNPVGTGHAAGVVNIYSVLQSPKQSACT